MQASTTTVEGRVTLARCILMILERQNATFAMARGTAHMLVLEPRSVARSRLERISRAVARACSYSPYLVRPSKLYRSLDERPESARDAGTLVSARWRIGN